MTDIEYRETQAMLERINACAKSENRANGLSVKSREVFGDKIKLGFSENPKGLLTGVGLLALVGGEYKHSHLKKIENQAELKRRKKNE